MMYLYINITVQFHLNPPSFLLTTAGHDQLDYIAPVPLHQPHYQLKHLYYLQFN